MNLFEISNLEIRLKDLESKTNNASFWEDSKNSTKILKEINEIKAKIHMYNNIKNNLENVIQMNDLIQEEKEESLEEELKDSIKNLQKEIDKLEINTLLSGKYDKNNAILTIHPGAGGTESCDWAQMLYRMYTRWALDNGYEVKELDYLDGEEAGLKSVTFLVKGSYAYGYLKGEMGVHRLVRISPFDSGGRRHTSFASLEVLPEISEDIEININPDDLRVDTYRASGAGGQHVNKTDTAMKMLKSKLLNLKEKEHKDKIEDLKGNQMDIAWGSQIRSYVFCPYTMVKDHRTNYEVGNIQAVMDGDLNDFMDAYLKMESKSQNKE